MTLMVMIAVVIVALALSIAITFLYVRTIIPKLCQILDWIISRFAHSPFNNKSYYSRQKGNDAFSSICHVKPMNKSPFNANVGRIVEFGVKHGIGYSSIDDKGNKESQNRNRERNDGNPENGFHDAKPSTPTQGESTKSELNPRISRVDEWATSNVYSCERFSAGFDAGLTATIFRG